MLPLLFIKSESLLLDGFGDSQMFDNSRDCQVLLQLLAEGINGDFFLAFWFYFTTAEAPAQELLAQILIMIAT